MEKLNLDSIAFNEKITREDLLTVRTQEEIFSFYMGESITQLGVYHSPLREDNIPSFALYFHKRERDTLMFYDFATKDSGDFIVLVMKLFSLNYKEALHKIAYDLGILSTPVNPGHIQSNYTRIVAKEKVRLGIRKRYWMSHDKEFWKSFGITKATLEKFNVCPIDYIFYNDNAVSAHKYAYAYIEFKDGNVSYKIYQPFEERHKKWVNNADYSVHQGYMQLPQSGELLIITKSLKDVMSINDCLGISAIGLQSESVMMKASVMGEYKARFSKVICLFDNDEAGVRLAKSFIEEFNVPYFIVPKIKEKTKDFSDLVRDAGKENAVKIVKNLINEIRAKESN
jgi:5S rRNA maturation endonuclease (ribonuclease M5)